jgi:FkbM family methyltransferase
VSLLQRLVRRCGYDLSPLRKAKAGHAQLAAILHHQGITTVLDVGANVGQYGQRLRDWGYAGRIVSFEPLADAHAALTRRAAGDPDWIVAAPCAIGAAGGEVEIQRSAESDMSSILPQSDLLRRLSPSSAIQGIERVPLRRLDDIAPAYLQSAERPFLKIDTQGYEPAVLDGALDFIPRLVGIQLEMSLLPLYREETGFQAMLERLQALGFELHLVLPGYFARKLARQVEIDGVFIRAAAVDGGPAIN